MPIDRFASSSRWAPTIGFSGAVRAGDWVTTAGMTAATPDGTIIGADSAHEQARETLRKVVAALAEAGATVEQVVRTRMYVVSAEHGEAVGRAHGEVFAAARPAATLVVVSGLLDPRMLVEIEAVAYLGR